MEPGDEGHWWVVAGDRRVLVSPGDTLIVGRGDEADLRLETPVVSRRHLRLTNTDGRVEAEDLGSRRGSFIGGRRLEGTLLLVPPVTIELGPDAQPTVTIAAPRPATPATPARDAAAPTPGEVPLGDRLVIGRDLGGAGLSLDDDLMVSRQHAVVVRSGAGWRVIDQGSHNGTFVNGVRVSDAALADGDRLTVGQASFVLHRGALRAFDEGATPALVLSHVSRRLPSGKVLLDDVSLQLPNSSMLGVVGPSGAGKSTLLGALTGDRPATSGQVFYAGRDLTTSLDEIRTRIGFVPQDDIVHRQLRLRDALLYAAQLRLPDDVAPAQREARVDAVLAELGLAEHGATRVDRLSGGQRKRASVAMELLTSPSFLLLDEPTSGLDPALDRQLMQSLRTLADGGRTVVVISHNTSELHLCDAVLFLAPGGRVAYFGPPAELLAWFGSRDFADAFELAYRDPDSVVTRFRDQRSGSWSEPSVPGTAAAAVRPDRAPLGRVLQQWSTLVRRQVRALSADAGVLAFSAAMPVALAALALLVPGEQGLRGAASGKVPTGQPLQILLILVVGAVFMGLASSIRELVGERTIFLRERAVGLSRSAYLGAKVTVLGAVVAVQVLVVLGIVLSVRPGPEEPLWLHGGAELAMALGALGLVNVVLGLALSGLIRTPGQTMPVLVMVVMAELVFTSGLFSLADRDAIDLVSRLFPSRWGFAAGASVLDLNTILASADDPLWAHSVGRYLLNLGAVVFSEVALGALAWWTTGRRYADR